MIGTSLEKFFTTKMPGVAARGVCLKKHDDAIEILFDGLTRWLINLEKQYGADCLEMIRNTQFEVGVEVGKQLKEEYKLGSDITDALDLMWMLIVPFGIRMKAQRIEEGRIREEKLACPILDIFRKHGVDYCELLCISLNSGFLYAINPNLKFEIVRRGSKDHYCIKDVVDTGKVPSKV